MSLPAINHKNKEALQSEEIFLLDIQNTHKMCEALMKTPHYAKIGSPGIFAIVQKAKALNINPLDALNGGLYCVNGKVEMSAQMMSQLIRQSGHSFTKDKRSDDTICILHGKRKDNGDTWTESFSIEDAKRAGIYKTGGVWEKFPRNMLYARALSNLARQLFSDIIKGCYVEGEISQASPLNSPVSYKVQEEKINENTGEVSSYEKISHDQFVEINDLMKEDEEYKNSVKKFLLKQVGSDRLEDMPMAFFSKIKARAEANRSSRDQVMVSIDSNEEEVS